MASPAVPAETADIARVKTVVESVAILADSANFESLEKLYAPEVKLDYTSLAGGQPELKKPEQIMSQWAAVLPGFDRTRHALSNLKVQVHGASATATVDLVADHYHGQMFWQVRGNYDYSLEKQDGEWRITLHRLNVTGETGSRDIFGPAIATAKQNPVSYLKRLHTQQVVRDFVTCLETKDMAKFAELWAEDGVDEIPFAPANFPKRVEGKAEILKHFSGWPHLIGKANMTKELVLHPLQDPESVVAEWHGVADITSTGRNYDQRYVALFTVKNGKVVLFREYFDPAPFVYAFKWNEGGNFGNK